MRVRPPDDETDTGADAPERNIISSWLAGPPLMRITQEAFLKLMWSLGREAFHREEAGLLVGPTDRDLITDFVEDQHGQATAASFTLNGRRLTRIVRQLKLRGLEVKGIAHSHPDGVIRPSHGDLRYLNRLFNNPKNDGAEQIVFPIVCRQRLWPYVVTSAGEVCTAELVLV
jgi:proteasome lid subunit RPN8/RPN11